MQNDRPLNRFQRWYFGWAEPYYQRMPEPLQAQARSMDRFLYSRRSLGLVLGLLMGVSGSSIGLHAGGMPWPGAIGLSLLFVGGVSLAMLGAWLRPDLFSRHGGGPRKLLLVVLGGLAGVTVGWMTGRVAKKGWETAWNDLAGDSIRFLQVGLPAGAAVVLVMLLLMWVAASAGRYQMQQDLARLRDAEERARMAGEASEARLRLLQAQIQPHFIFNTLSAVQHWVDSGDARASGLLRALTGFLRGSAELMLQPRVSLAAELTLVEQYLLVMQARLGERLRFTLDIDPACAAAATLPPGIVLSLVENALEHGIAPALSGGTLQLRLQAIEDGWLLQVRDDGVGLSPDWQEGLGLGNSRARLEQAFGGRATLTVASEAAGTLVALRVQEEAGHAR